MSSRFREIEAGAYAQRAEEVLGAGRIPVPTPSDPSRRERWRATLAVYDATLGPDRGACPPPPGGCIVTAGAAFAPVARLLAAATGYPLESTDEHCPRAPEGARAVTFVGPTHVFDARRVRAIAATTEIPWTLVTAVDPDGAGFATAKLLALARSDRIPAATVLADGIAGRSVFLAPDGDESDLGPELALTNDEPHGALVLHTHGEGAHADLGHTCVCGLIGDVERDRDGRPVPGGCGPQRCKRRSQRHEGLALFRNLLAFRLALLSCNGYSPGAELYPSDLSAPLACGEGMAAEVVTSLLPLAFPGGLPLALARRARSGADLADLAAAATEHARAQGTVGGFVRIGAVAEPASTVRRLPDSHDDGQAELLAAAAQLAWLAPRQARAERWTARLRDRAESLDEEAEDLLGATLTAGEALATAQDVWSGSATERRARSALLASMQLVELAVRNYDALLARVLDAPLPGVQPAEALHGGSPGPPIANGSACERCGAALERRYLACPGLEEAATSSCPNCGERDLWWPADGDLRVSAPAAAAPGESVEIVVRRDPIPAPGANRNGWVVAQLREKAGERPVVSQRGQARDGEASLAIRLPDDCPPDLHTLRVSWIETLTLATARRRIACVPWTGKVGSPDDV